MQIKLLVSLRYYLDIVDLEMSIYPERNFLLSSGLSEPFSK